MSNDSDRREIIRLINEWNSSRYELFALSQPNERCEFHGVMRFYFQDAGEKVSTKCIRVDSTATTEDVIQVLIEKFRPDMKSLSSPKDYAIYEVHADSQERKLESGERPLWIQLEWGKDGREGRFLLKNENCKTVQFDTNVETMIRDKKRLSKRDKKKLQKQKESQKENSKVNVAENLYKEVPDSNFTRSISNPEIVMARRRQQKLENKLKQIKNKDGGGTLKVYGETLKPDIPYKTLLMSNQDTAAFAVKETLEKYGLTNEDPENYCLVQVVTPSREEREKHGAQIKEYILEDTACPLAILMKHPSTGGSIIFQIRRCTPDILAIRKQKKKAEIEKQQQLQQHQQHQQHQQQIKFQTIQSQPNLQTNNPKQRSVNFHTQQTDIISETNMNQQQDAAKLLPYLVEMSYEGFDLPQPRLIQIKSDFYEIGNDKNLAATHPLNYIRIDSTIPGIERKHCAIKKSNDNLQLLLIPYAETYINDRLVKEHTQLFNNFTIRLGKYCLFRLENPNEVNGLVVANNNPNPNQMINHHKSVQQQQQQQQPPVLPANYGLLYDSGQIAETVSQPTRALSPSVPIQHQLRMTQQTPQPIIPVKQVQPVLNNTELALPGLLEFQDDNEDSLLAAICTTNQTTSNFKLAPVYTMYMMLRYRLSQKYKSDLNHHEKLNTLPYLIHKMVNFIREAVDVNHLDKFILPYWLANSSELLYFLKQDAHLAQISFDAQDALADCVQITFKYLVNIMQQQLDMVLVSFFDPSDHIEDVNLNPQEQIESNFDHLTSRPTLKEVIQVLNEAMNLLRGSRVNAALTIQLFSQLFHYISMWLFNRLIKDQRSGLCSRYWGDKLSRRLNKIQVWAEKQGLELAADCHLQRISQASYFLLSPKHDIQDLSTISSNCFALNSLQIKCLIKNYLLAPNEPALSAQLCNNLIAIAQNTADEVIKQEGKLLQLEEDVDLQLPFLLPEDGHSSEFIKGLPAGLLDFIEALQNAGHCSLWQNTQGPGSWKKYMVKDQNLNQQNINGVASEPAQLKQQISSQQQQQQPLTYQNQPTTPITQQQPSQIFNKKNSLTETPQLNQKPLLTGQPQIIKLQLAKKNNGLGLSIVAARGNNQVTGIYIKSVVPGGAAHDDGRLSAGDQLLAVDEYSLVDVTQERAAELMTKSGPVVMLTIAKNAAAYYDLDALLNKSPQQAQQQAQTQQQSMTTSMPALNNQNFSNGQFIHQQMSQPQQQLTFSAATLPRNHHLHQINQQQTQQIYNEQINENSSNRTRSMSQEILNPRNGPGQIPPQIQNRPIPQITSPTNQFNQRCLPNEQQMRFGSERPASSFNQQQQQQFDPRFINQRTLPNDLVPRFGSERPASTLSHHQQRFNSETSPIKQSQFQQMRQRQASISEIDEINYNNQNMIEKNNKFDDLYGKVNPNRNSVQSFNQQQQQQQIQPEQYKTLPSRTNHINGQVINGSNHSQQPQSLEESRAKSFGLLYEQIWANDNQNNQNNNVNQINIPQAHPRFNKQLSVDELNMNRLEINSNQTRVTQARLDLIDHNNATNSKISRTNIQQFEQTNVRVMPLQPHVSQPLSNGNSNSQLRNYENQVINQNGQNHTKPPAPAVLAKPAIPAKNFNLNIQQNGSRFQQNESNNNNHQPIELQVHQNGFIHGTAKIVNQKENTLTREKADEEFRLNLLKQRIEMLNDLESKSYRTNEEENKLNKLRTEIEFDKRVIEMNTQMNYLDETCEDNDMLEYAPEVRERFANEIMQRRKLFQNENSNKQQEQEYAQKLEERFNQLNKEKQNMEKLRNDEADRILEAKREELRLRKHVDLNRNSGSNIYQQNEDYNQNNFQEIEVLHVPTRSSADLSELSVSRTQKHVQFMPDSELISPKSGLKTVTSSSSSSDQLDSSPSTPPPLPVQPQPNHHPKRVMFSDIEFERKDSKNDDIIHNTPSVIGANEVYVDQRLKLKQQQQLMQQERIIEGEKLSFKDKMKLFAKQSGENLASDAEAKLKVSKKQREIESKFVVESK